MRREKAARFVRICDAFNIPLVTLVDVPGFLPGTDQEHGGIIRHGAQAAVRLLRGDGAADPGDPAQGVRRRVHRDGLPVHRRGPRRFAWPTNEIAVMGAEAAADVIFRREIAAAADPAASPAGAGGGVRRHRSWTPTSPRSADSWTTSSSPRRRGRCSSRPSRCSTRNEIDVPRASTATSRCERAMNPPRSSPDLGRGAPREPWLTVVRGRPTDEELAALVAAVRTLADQLKRADAEQHVATLRRTGRSGESPRGGRRAAQRPARWTEAEYVARGGTAAPSPPRPGELADGD